MFQGVLTLRAFSHPKTLLQLLLAITLPLQLSAQDPNSDAVEAAIRHARAAGARVQQISASEPALEVSFQLAGVEVNDQSLAGLSAIPQVIWLNLAGTKVTDAGLRELAKLETLERLHLEKTAIGDTGIDHLLGLSKLQYLNLYGTQVTDAGLDKLTQLKQLKRVYVWQSQVTEEGIRKLRESLPDCRVIGEVKLAPPAAPPAEQPSGQTPSEAKPGGGEASTPDKDK